VEAVEGERKGEKSIVSDETPSIISRFNSTHDKQHHRQAGKQAGKKGEILS